MSELVKPDNLTNKQWAFVLEYPKDWNATQAAIRAGYSKDTAHAIGWENLRKPEIEAAMIDAFNSMAMGSQEMWAAIAKIARGIPQNLQNFLEHGSLQDVIDAGYGDLIKSYTETQHGYRIELYDRKSALEMIGRGHAAFTDRHESEQTTHIMVDIKGEDDE